MKKIYAVIAVFLLFTLIINLNPVSAFFNNCITKCSHHLRYSESPNDPEVQRGQRRYAGCMSSCERKMNQQGSNKDQGFWDDFWDEFAESAAEIATEVILEWLNSN